MHINSLASLEGIGAMFSVNAFSNHIFISYILNYYNNFSTKNLKKYNPNMTLIILSSLYMSNSIHKRRKDGVSDMVLLFGSPLDFLFSRSVKVEIDGWRLDQKRKRKKNYAPSYFTLTC